MDASELIERLEKAKEPTLALDGEVWCSVNGYEFVMWDGAGCVYRDPSAPAWDRGIKHVSHREVRPYTASLDAALALCIRVLPGWEWLRKSPNTMTVYRPLTDEEDARKEWGRHFDAGHSSPAIALVLAVLRASLTKPSEGRE